MSPSICLRWSPKHGVNVLILLVRQLTERCARSIGADKVKRLRYATRMERRYPKLWEDTSPEAERVLLLGYRNMSGARKLQQVTELTFAVQQLALARLRMEDPTATDRELQLRLASLWLPPELLERVMEQARKQGKA